MQTLNIDNPNFSFIPNINISPLVGGGSPISPGTPVPGTPQAIAVGLVPQGLSPVAFFPATAAQTMPAISVIFSESLLVGKRKKRGAWKYEDRGYQGTNVTRYKRII